MAPLLTGLAGSRYRVVRRLAIGGMAELYEAEAIGVRGVSKRVAIKRVLPRYAKDAAFIAMFAEEARVASTLHHANIVQTLDVIESEGQLLLVMELLDGLDLLQFCRRMHRNGITPTVGQLLHIVDRVLSALHYAHERATPDGRPLGVVHRDVSPQNVFLTVDGVKLLDFGVAKAESVLERGTSSGSSGVIKGKILYLSPEQILGGQIDRRSDEYALGVVMYQLLTGRHPQRGRSAYDTMRAILNDPIVRPSVHVPQMWRDLEQVVIRALEKNPAERYPNVREMQRALSAVVQAHSCHVSDVDFGTFVERVLKLDPRPPNAEDGAPTVPLAPSPLPGPGPAADSPTVELQTDNASIDRISGVTVVRLVGLIDERFDAETVMPWMIGTVVLDTSGVERITSYGIRALLALMDAFSGRVDELYHLDCSVTFVQQVGMIRRLLGGGKVVSFQVPYIDPRDKSSFFETLSGEEARNALLHRRAPLRSCPGAPERLAMFDDDPDTYLCFGQDFQAELPEHVAVVLESLRRDQRQRLIEKDVTASGTTVWIRRPLTRQVRWPGLFRGLEGAVTLELGHVPSWTAAGVEGMAGALTRESAAIAQLTVKGAPHDLVPLLSEAPELRGRVRIVSVKLPARCAPCGVQRTVLLDEAAFRGLANGAVLPMTCLSCGGRMVSMAGAEAPAVPAAPPRFPIRLWVGVAVVVCGGLLLMAMVLMVMAVSVAAVGVGP